MTDELVSIDENRKVNGKYFKLVFRSKSLSRKAEPGQFLHMDLHPSAAPFVSLDPFLRRPFSYYRIAKDRIEILYEVLGRGTAVLAGKKRGELLKVLGPLGRSFAKSAGKKKRVLVAGGVGVPPILFLAERYGAEHLLIGCKSKQEVLPKKELSKAKTEILYATNDGSYGAKGFITVLLEKLIKKESPEKLFIQTCGPQVMMQAVIQMARRHGIDGEASLDETMACGVGSCLGCMVKTPKGWVPSCVEGPVFGFNELVHESV